MRELTTIRVRSLAFYFMKVQIGVCKQLNLMLRGLIHKRQNSTTITGEVLFLLSTV